MGTLNSKYLSFWIANTFCFEQQILSTFSIFSGLARRLLLRCGSQPVATGNELINILGVYKMCLASPPETDIWTRFLFLNLNKLNLMHNFCKTQSFHCRWAFSVLKVLLKFSWTSKEMFVEVWCITYVTKYTQNVEKYTQVFSIVFEEEENVFTILQAFIYYYWRITMKKIK